MVQERGFDTFKSLHGPVIPVRNAGDNTNSAVALSQYFFCKGSHGRTIVEPDRRLLVFLIECPRHQYRNIPMLKITIDLWIAFVSD